MTAPALFPDIASFSAAIEQVRDAEVAYEQGEPIMSDADFDTLKDRVQATKDAHPDWDDKGVTTEVASGALTSGEKPHPIPMLSLAKAKTLDEVVKFIASLNGEAAVVEPKIDGCAVRAYYENGVLVEAALRGGGTQGEEITDQVLRGIGITGLPARLPVVWTGHVRGEIYMSDENFELANDARVASGKPAFANPRNATSGSLRNRDRTYDVPMSFGAYDIMGDTVDTMDEYGERMVYAKHTLGLGTAFHLAPEVPKTCDDVNAVLASIKMIEDRRASLGFPIDGAVIKVDSFAARDRFGTRSNSPRWATSYKYAPDTAVTKFLDIEISVGRTGRLGFRARLAPVHVAGSEIEYTTMHNAPWILDRDLRINDEVWVYKAGDVIPRVTTPNLINRPADAQPWQAPDNCPQCDEPLDKTSKLWRCHTPSCAAANALVYFTGSEAMDVDNIGQAICEALVETYDEFTIADLFDLSTEQWANLRVGTTEAGAPRLVGMATAEKIVANLEASKEQPFNRVITGLGIRMTGRSVGRWLAAHFKTMDALRSATVEEIAEIHKLGDKKATFIVNGLRRLGPVIDRLAAHGLPMEVRETAGPKPLTGQTYAVSGAVPGYTRDTIADRITELGGVFATSVGPKITALVTAEETTTKAKKAASLGKPIISPADFAAMIA